MKSLNVLEYQWIELVIKRENRTSMLAGLNYGLRNCEIKTIIEKLTILRDLGPRGMKIGSKSEICFWRILEKSRPGLLAVCPSHLIESFGRSTEWDGEDISDSSQEPSSLFILPAGIVLHLLRAPGASEWWDLENLSLEFSLSKHCSYITQEHRLHGSPCKGFSVRMELSRPEAVHSRGYCSQQCEELGQ